jgi:hypothetical protein
MFAVGQTVYHKTRKLSGTVVDCDGDTVYLTQENGVEIDFPSRDLTATAPVERNRLAPPSDNLSRVLTMADITPEHQRVLAIIPQRSLQAVAAMFEKRPKAGRFSALDVAQKLNFIAEVTDVPYRTMREYSDRPSELGLLMGRGLSIRSGSAR